MCTGPVGEFLGKTMDMGKATGLVGPLGPGDVIGNKVMGAALPSGDGAKNAKQGIAASGGGSAPGADLLLPAFVPGTSGFKTLTGQ